MSFIQIPKQCSDFAEEVTVSKRCYPAPQPVVIPEEVEGDFYRIIKGTIQDFDWVNPVDEDFVEALSLSLQDLFATPRGLQVFPANRANRALNVRNEDISFMIRGSSENFIFETFEALGSTIAWEVVNNLDKIVEKDYGVEGLFSYDEEVVFDPKPQEEKMVTPKKAFLNRVVEEYCKDAKAAGHDSRYEQEVTKWFVEKMMTYHFINLDREPVKKYIKEEIVVPIYSRGFSKESNISPVNCWILEKEIRDSTNLFLRALEKVGFSDYGVGIFYDRNISFGKNGLKSDLRYIR